MNCSIEGCAGLHQAKGLCDTHYRSLMRSGNPKSAKPRAAPQKPGLLAQWLKDNPKGGLVKELAFLLGSSEEPVRFALCNLVKQGLALWRPDGDGKAHMRKRYFAPEHVPPESEKTQRPAKLIVVKSRYQALDQSTPAVCNVKPTKCPGFTGIHPFAVTEAPALFSAMNPGSYLPGGWTEQAYGERA